MHFTTILLLLLAFIGFSSATTNWAEEDIERAQAQVDLILHAKSERNFDLLFKLIPSGEEMDNYLIRYGSKMDVRIIQAMALESRAIKAIATIEIRFEVIGLVRQRAELTLTRDTNSPTGYVMTEWVICETECELDPASLKFI